MSSTPRDWSVNDRRFLRSLGIEAGEPPTQSPRFVVEPGRVDGEFQVIDRARRHTTVFTPKSFKDPRAAAEDVASQLNQKHAGGAK